MSTDDRHLFVRAGRALGLAAALTQWAVLEDRARRRRKQQRAYAKWAERENRRILNQGRGTQVRLNPKIGRNDPCPCGSGRKFKRCCIDAGVYNSTMEKGK